MRADLDAPRKQRHSIKRLHARLIEEHDAEVSYSAVRDYVSRRREEIRVALHQFAERRGAWLGDDLAAITLITSLID